MLLDGFQLALELVARSQVGQVCPVAGEKQRGDELQDARGDRLPRAKGNYSRDQKDDEIYPAYHVASDNADVHINTNRVLQSRQVGQN